jgi:ATP-dependent helicase/nuclease subunit B
MLTRGAFGDAPGTLVEAATYIKLGGATGGLERPLVFDRQDSDLMEVAERHYTGLLRLLAQFRNPETPYIPRPFPKFAARFNAYDHLARTGEWSMGSDEDEA